MSTTKSPWTLANNHAAPLSTQEQEILPYNDPWYQTVRLDYQRVSLKDTSLTLILDPLISANETYLIDDGCANTAARVVVLPPSDSMIGKSISFFVATQTNAITSGNYVFKSSNLTGSRMLGTILYDGDTEINTCNIVTSLTGRLTENGSVIHSQITCKPLAGSRFKFTSAGAFWIVEAIIQLNGGSTIPAFGAAS